MHWGKDKSERFRELTARIAAEQDHDKFTVLVKELNELLNGKETTKDRSTERIVARMDAPFCGTIFPLR